MHSLINVTNNAEFAVQHFIHNLGRCQDALGMSDGVITDAQITASSEWNPVSHSVSFGRLYNKTGSGAWVVRIIDLSQWIQVDVGRQRTRITRIATQGRYNYPQWVTKYSLQVSNDGENFQYYKEQDQATNKVPYNSENKPLCLKDPPLQSSPPPPHPQQKRRGGSCVAEDRF